MVSYGIHTRHSLGNVWVVWGVVNDGGSDDGARSLVFGFVTQEPSRAVGINAKPTNIMVSLGWCLRSAGHIYIMIMFPDGWAKRGTRVLYEEVVGEGGGGSCFERFCLKGIIFFSFYIQLIQQKNILFINSVLSLGIQCEIYVNFIYEYIKKHRNVTILFKYKFDLLWASSI